MRLAITGATGFVGARLLAAARAAGHDVRALVRRAQPDTPGIAWVRGSLDDAGALIALMEGADAVIHVAGVVNAPDRAGFVAGNIDGTRHVVDAARAAGPARLVHVSSLAAREPALSTYGWSKAEAEAIVAGSGLAWSMVRPPGVYGPGDRDMLELFRLARRGLGFAPPGGGRISVIHVDDLARLLLALAAASAASCIYEPDDGTPGGWSHGDFARALGDAVGRRVRTITLPRALLDLAARADRLVRGDGARLTADRVGYLCYPDWTADPARRPPPALWTPQIATPAGLAATAEWYRAHALL